MCQRRWSPMTSSVTSGASCGVSARRTWSRKPSEGRAHPGAHPHSAAPPAAARGPRPAHHQQTPRGLRPPHPDCKLTCDQRVRPPLWMLHPRLWRLLPGDRPPSSSWAATRAPREATGPHAPLQTLPVTAAHVSPSATCHRWRGPSEGLAAAGSNGSGQCGTDGWEPPLRPQHRVACLALGTVALLSW